MKPDSVTGYHESILDAASQLEPTVPPTYAAACIVVIKVSTLSLSQQCCASADISSSL